MRTGTHYVHQPFIPVAVVCMHCVTTLGRTDVLWRQCRHLTLGRFVTTCSGLETADTAPKGVS